MSAVTMETITRYEEHIMMDPEVSDLGLAPLSQAAIINGSEPPSDQSGLRTPSHCGITVYHITPVFSVCLSATLFLLLEEFLRLF